MRISTYDKFIKENIAPPNAKSIGIYNSYNRRVGGFGLQSLALPDVGDKLYSFMAISDSHIIGVASNDGDMDLKRALDYAENNNDISFTCHCGDVVDSGTPYRLGEFKNLKAKYTKPIRVITGNHEEITATGNVELAYNSLTEYYGDPLYYSFNCENDVFIMLGESGYTTGSMFADGELQFMYNTLEANRNKRCFVFMHVFNYTEGDSGTLCGQYGSDVFLSGDSAYRQKEKECFLNLLRHYKNSIWFHGHSHARIEMQGADRGANYSEALGYRSVHIPSITKPKDLINGSVVTLDELSQGYIVDVYSDNVVLRARDYVNNRWIPLGQYCLNTTIQTVSVTFSDSTGIINTGGDTVG